MQLHNVMEPEGTSRRALCQTIPRQACSLTDMLHRTLQVLEASHLPLCEAAWLQHLSKHCANGPRTAETVHTWLWQQS